MSARTIATSSSGCSRPPTAARRSRRSPTLDPTFDVERAYETLRGPARAAASRRAGARSDARSASPTARSGRATAWIARCGRWCGIARSFTRRAARRRSTSRGCTSRASSPRSCSGSRRRCRKDGGARAMLDAVAWIAPGFEIVHSVFPGWKFRVPDCTAAFGLHGRLVVGPPTRVEPDNARRARRHAADVPRDAAPRRRDRRHRRRRERSRRSRARARALARRARVAAALSRARRRRDRHDRNAHRCMAGRSGETWTSDYGELPIRGLALTIR